MIDLKQITKQFEEKYAPKNREYITQLIKNSRKIGNISELSAQDLLKNLKTNKNESKI